MKARDVVGRRIVAVEQGRDRSTAGMVTSLTQIVLDDGTRLTMAVQESHDASHYIVEPVVHKPDAATRRAARTRVPDRPSASVLRGVIGAAAFALAGEHEWTGNEATDARRARDIAAASAWAKAQRR